MKFWVDMELLNGRKTALMRALIVRAQSEDEARLAALVELMDIEPDGHRWRVRECRRVE